MSYQTLIYEKEGGLGRITLNRPQAMNAITPDLLRELKTAVEEAGRDDQVKVIVLTGAGKAFCAGVDLKALGDRRLINGKVGDILDIPARDVIRTIGLVPKAVIALVNGFCFTGALEIVLGCDIIIAAEEARLGDTHAKWALRPTWGMSARLPRQVGFTKAKELSFTADALTGQEAERIGLVNLAVPAEKLEEALQTMTRKIMANSQESIAAYKQLYNANAGLSLDQALGLEFGSEFSISGTEERLAQFRK